MASMQERDDVLIEPLWRGLLTRRRVIRGLTVYWLGIRCLPIFFDDAFYRFERDRPLTHGLDWLLEPFELPFRAFSTDPQLFAEQDRWIIFLAFVSAIAVNVDWRRAWPVLRRLSAAVDDWFSS